MNILFLAYNVNIHSKTGDAVHVRELALNLAALGNKVSLVVVFNPGSKEDISSLTNNPNIDLQYVKKPKFKYPRSRDVSILSLCFNIVKNNSFDIIYERNFSCRIGVILSKIKRIPLVVEINGLVDEEAKIQGKKASELRSLIGKKMRVFFFRQANKIVAVTTGIKKELVNSYKIPPNSIEVIPNGANTDLFKPMDQGKVRAELGLSQELKYICFVGNLAPWQGVEYLIQAAPRIIASCPDARFLIIGDGIMKNSLIQLSLKHKIFDKFIFTGSVPYEKVPMYINASNLGVAPSSRDERNEKTGGSSMKIFEYLACEKPVVTGNLDGDNDLVLKSNGGYVVSAEKTNELGYAIISLLKNIELGKKMGQNGRKYVLENHSWNSVATTILKIIT